MLFDASVDDDRRTVEVRREAGRYAVTVDGRALDVDVAPTGDGFLSLLIDGRSHEVAVEQEEGLLVVHFPAQSVRVALSSGGVVGAAPAARESGPARVSAPMPGRVVRVLVAQGDDVDAGRGLVVVEAMKMENELRAPRAGRVLEVAVREGQAVETGALLLVVG